ncbi:MAG: ABC transporter ATP-binding protein [Tepidanaerobacteraceae bacterium]
MEKAVVLKNITKRFPGVVANDRINLEVQKGEIHAIVGENGAGKSTLMKILAGLYQPDEGEIFVFGKKEEICSPSKAIELKIGMVHQHFMLVDRFTVLENIILGAEKKKGFFIDQKACRETVKKLLDLYNFKLDVDAKLEDISVGHAQRVEIMKVLYRGADILVLDEPTAVLAPQEAEELFVNLKRLKEEGKTIIFISHKLDEVLSIADNITVLRQGKAVGTVPANSVTKEELARMMIGKPVLIKLDKTPAEKGEIKLSLQDLIIKGHGGKNLLNGVTFKVYGGEIYGIVGVEGNGQKELAEVIIGLLQDYDGDIKVNGKSTKGLTIKQIRDMGVGFIPEDRHRQGLVLSMKVWENSILGLHRKEEFSKKTSINMKKAEEFSSNNVKEYSIMISSIHQAVENLSGGNQQKVILSRELSQNPSVVLAVQPTRGLDIGAMEFVHRQLLEKRLEGKAVLLISADLEEVLSISDRIGVIFDGEIVAEFTPEEITLEDIGVYMLGAHKKVGESS